MPMRPEPGKVELAPWAAVAKLAEGAAATGLLPWAAIALDNEGAALKDQLPPVLGLERRMPAWRRRQEVRMRGGRGRWAGKV